jgi:two-component system, LuxR family, sensor kinase FixL
MHSTSGKDSVYAHYALAVALVVAAVLVRWFLDPLFRSQLPFWTFWVAIGIAVWRGGLGPALVAGVLGFLAGDYFFVDPRRDIGLASAFNLAILGAYLAVSTIICALGVVMRAAQARSEKKHQETLRQKELLERKARERESGEALLRTVLETLPVGVWILNARGEIQQGNAAGQKIWSGARYVGMNQFGEYKGWWADTGKRIEPHEWGAARAITKGEVSLDEEIQIEAFNGARKFILHAAVPLRERPGDAVTGAIVVNQDITRRKRAEDALRHQNCRIALLHEAAAHLLSSESPGSEIAGLYQRVGEFFQADAFLEYAVDERRRMLHLQVSGGIPEDSREVLAHVDFARAICHVFPERRQPVMAMNIQNSNDPAVQAVRGLGIRAYSCHPLLAGDRLLGTLAFASRHRDTFAPEDQEFFQTLARYVAVARERARLSAELQRHNEHLEELVIERTARLDESSERLRAIVETAAEGIVTIDEHGIIETVNPAAERIFGYSAAEMLWRNVKMLMAEPERSRHDDFLAQYRRTGERKVIGQGREVGGRRKDGTVFPLELAVSESWVGSKRFFTGLLRDITLRKQAEQRWRETTQELEQFSYSIIHDMRAPLRAIHGFGELLRDDPNNTLDSEGRDCLRRIMEAAQRMDQLITDALNYTKILREDLPVQAIDPLPLLRGILESYPEFQASPGVIEIAGPFPLVLANRAGLTQCFSNFLSNAIKFAKPGEPPRVRFWSEDRGAMVRLWFEDQGIGIAPDFQQRIFGMFQQLTPGQQGTGMGLALVCKVADRMRGRVGVESKLGEGSRFWLELRKP